MENLILTPDEQKLLLKFKTIIEHNYKVNIYLPSYIPSCEHDVVVATVFGGKSNQVKNFIQRRLNERNQRHEQRVSVQDDVTVITLSDSDSDSSLSVQMQMPQKRNKKQRRSKKKHAVNTKLNTLEDLSSTILVEDSDESSTEDSVQQQSSDQSPSSSDFLPLKTEKENAWDSYEFVKKHSNKQKTASSALSPAYTFLNLPQTTGNFSHDALEETITLCDSPPPTPDFILLNSKQKEKTPLNIPDDSIIIVEDEIPAPIAIKPKCLRPVVIDGSNVAREHGKISNTFSCKGIKIAIDYFLQRGHPQVTAFVPQYRRHCKFGPILTTDQPLLEELAKEQRVVFTPSRRINNKRVTCYDDRFIVELAAKTGGVVLSNDNYRDLAQENEEFQKTINERLLMFCFVGDIIMIPQDPLGRHGPSLENFLAFPDS